MSQVEVTVGNIVDTINFAITINNLEEAFVTTCKITMANQDIIIYTDFNVF